MTIQPSLDRVKVVHLATYGGPYAGSFIPAVRALARAVRERGWSFEIVFSPFAQGRPWLRDLESDEISVSFAPRRVWPDGFIWLTRRLRADATPTVVHSHFSGYDLMTAAAGVLGRPRSVVFWQVHTRVRSEPLTVARNLVKYAVLSRGVDQILCVAPDMAEAVRRRGARKEGVHLLPNAIDLRRFPVATATERAQARRELGLPVEGNVLLHFGRDWELKGGDIFLQAVGLLRDREPTRRVVAVTVGGGANARELAARLDLDPTVRVLEPRDDVWTFYAAADIFVSPSRAEGMPYSMIEALATGLSVVASDIPGQALIGKDVAACCLVGIDAHQVASAISEQIQFREQNVLDSEATRCVLGRKVDLAGWAQEVLALYLEALHSRVR